MHNMSLVAILIGLSLVVEHLVEMFLGTPFDKVEKLKPYRWILIYAAAGLGVAIALNFDLDMLSELGLSHTLLGQILTGVVIGGGSNLVHELLDIMRELQKT